MNNKEQGKKNRNAGKEFEKAVRKDLESKKWIVTKWSNNVEFKDGAGQCIPAKPQYNPFYKRIVGEGSGFPDFIAIQDITINGEKTRGIVGEDVIFKPGEEITLYSVIGVECKRAKYLTAEEKRKVKWLLESKTFSKILVAYPKDGKIIYEDQNG